MSEWLLYVLPDNLPPQKKCAHVLYRRMFHARIGSDDIITKTLAGVRAAACSSDISSQWMSKQDASMLLLPSTYK